MQWLDSVTFALGDTQFRVIESLDDLIRFESSSRRFLLGKWRPMVERYVTMRSALENAHILELGIFKGGSAAFFHELYRPRKLVAIDYERTRVAALDQFVAERGCSASLRPFYGVDQADAARLTELCDDEFAGQPLDLVVDDASHFLAATRASFNVLFPRLRPGGLYVIEDWGWAHLPHELFQSRDSPWAARPALTTLIFEILLALPSNPGLIEAVRIDGTMAVIERGRAPLAAGFDIQRRYLNRGRPFEPGL